MILIYDATVVVINYLKYQNFINSNSYFILILVALVAIIDKIMYLMIFIRQYLNFLNILTLIIFLFKVLVFIINLTT